MIVTDRRRFSAATGLETPGSAPTGSRLISIHFLKVLVVKRSKQFPIGYHFINSHTPFSCLCIDIVRRKLTLVTLGTQRVKRQPVADASRFLFVYLFLIVLTMYTYCTARVKEPSEKGTSKCINSQFRSKLTWVLVKSLIKYVLPEVHKQVPGESQSNAPISLQGNLLLEVTSSFYSIVFFLQCMFISEQINVQDKNLFLQFCLLIYLPLIL